MFDAVDTTTSMKFLMQNQLASFFRRLAALRAHWFRVVKLDENDLQSELMNSLTRGAHWFCVMITTFALYGKIRSLLI